MNLHAKMTGIDTVPSARCGGAGMAATLHDDGIFLDISDPAASFIGAEWSLVGRSIFEFVRPQDKSALRAAMRAASLFGGSRDGADARAPDTRAQVGLLRVRRAAAPVEIAFSPCGRRRLSAVICDRSDEFARRREACAARERAHIPDRPPLRPEADRTASEPGAKADRVADLSHEMKTPLSAIMGFADAMRAETFGPLGDDRYKEYAECIHASGAHLMELIGSILDSAKIEAGAYTINPTLTAPGDLARECAAMIRGEAERAGLAFKVHAAPDAPQVMIDRRVVRQILLNLLSNAVKFTGSGEIALDVSEKCGALDFVVRDTGVGMNKTMLAKLGGRFSDAHRDGVRGADGAGLGLSLAFKLARLHGGTLRIDSELGVGTTARLTLPLRGAKPAVKTGIADIHSQLDRVNAFRRERAAARANAA
jgi:cell cycle sensor histidine kinase DivJ